MIEDLLEPKTLAVAAIALLALLLIRWPNSLVFSSPRDPNVAQIPGLPLLGTTIAILRNRDRLLDYFLKVQRSVGPGGKPVTATFPPFGRVYLINRPGYIKHIQKTSFDNYPKGVFFRSLFSDLLGNHGIFVADGNIWKEERKTASTVFSAQSFRTHVTKALHGELDVLKKLYSNLADSGQEVNLQDIHFRFTLATFGVFAFDDNFDCLHADPAFLSRRVEFAHAFDYAQHVVDGRVTNPFWRIQEKLTPGGWKMARATKTIHTHAYNLIDKRRADYKEKGGNSALPKAEKEKMNLLQLFMGLTDDRRVLMETVLNFIIAGRDTTAQALSWWFWYLTGRPDIVSKIRDEVSRVLGPDGRVDYDNLKDLVYTTACFYETLRLHPSVPKNMKYVAADDVIQGGDEEHGLQPVHVRKGDTVIFSDWIMARMPEVWGADAESYKPERFLDESGTKLVKESQFRFHAFNAGPRLCLGQQLATYEAVSVVAEVLRSFDVKDVVPRSGKCGLEEGKAEKPPAYQNSLTLPIMDPYKVQFSKRQQA